MAISFFNCYLLEALSFSPFREQSVLAQTTMFLVTFATKCGGRLRFWHYLSNNARYSEGSCFEIFAFIMIFIELV